MVMGACPGQTPIPWTSPPSYPTAMACRYMKTNLLMSTTERSPRSTSLTGFKRVDPVIDAKKRPESDERRRRQSFPTIFTRVYVI